MTDPLTPDTPATPESPADANARRVEIARANGAKSRGPVTPEGKARSSRNSSKYGFLARTVVLPGESQKRFKRLHDKLRAELRPTSLVEQHLFENMVICRWRKLRYWGLQRGIIAFEVGQQTAASPHLSAESDLIRTSVGLREFSDTSPFLDKLTVWETRTDREYNRSLAQLLAGRRKPAPAPELGPGGPA